MTRSFDAIIIGTGQAGPPLACRLSAVGRKVAIIERDLVGGTCVNTGCVPTKTLVASAYAAHLACRAADFGVEWGPVRVDMAKVQARAMAVAAMARTGDEGWIRSLPGCELLFGHARFASGNCGGEFLCKSPCCQVTEVSLQCNMMSENALICHESDGAPERELRFQDWLAEREGFELIG